MSFEKLGLSDPILKAIQEKGYQVPSAIQAESIPAILKKTDVKACAQTGTGKTAGFVLPILEMLNHNVKRMAKSPRALILAPTRELASQINDSIIEYGKYLTLRSNVVYGGVKINRQILRLQNIVDIVVATPGRLLDLYNQRAIQFNSIEVVVLDEADRMLDMGFINDIKKILSLLPKNRQNLLFSATFSPAIRNFTKSLLNNAIEINVAPHDVTSKNIQHKIHPVDKTRKAELLSYLIRKNQWKQALVFTRTKHGANKLVQRLAKDNILALAIHGNKSQAQRLNALNSFKQGKIKILIATDIAARGIDIEQLPQVVNFDLPNVPEDYVHRIGRTGRAGACGNALSLYSHDEAKQLSDIEKVVKSPVKREVIAGFEPSTSPPATHPLPHPRSTGNRNFAGKSEEQRPGNGKKSFWRSRRKSTR